MVRRLGMFKVKGRVLPEALYALGDSAEQRFEASKVAEWAQWLDGIESGIESERNCPDCYRKDKNTINGWLSRNLLKDDGVWYLDEK